MDSTYTAPFNTTLTATFFTRPDQPGAADLIVPVSSRLSSFDRPSAFLVPQTNATSTFVIPRNVKRAIFTVSACGQLDEEFWWSNVLSSDTGTFPGNIMLGYSPFREVQLLIDGHLAGVSWPFPVIFTGGVVPGFWRPIVGIDAFELKEDEIDVSPWLSTLSDGKEHTYEIRVVGITDDGKGNGVLTTVGNYWVVSGKLFLWLDGGANGMVTSGSPVSQIEPDIDLRLTSTKIVGPDGSNLALNFQVLAQRHLSFSSLLTTSEGSGPVSWTQTLNYSNIGNLTAGGMDGTNIQMTSGIESSSYGYLRSFAYPLTVSERTTVESVSKNLSILASMDRGKNVQILGPSVFPSGLETLTPLSSYGDWEGSSVSTRQNGSATYTRGHAINSSISYGTTEQNYIFAGIGTGPSLQYALPQFMATVELYSRHVLAVNGSVTQDSNPHALIWKSRRER